MKIYSKKGWFIPMLLMMFMSNFALTSCGDDDKDEDIPSSGNSLLIGKWEQVDIRGNSLELLANGSGYESEGIDGEVWDIWPIKWTEDNDVLTIKDKGSSYTCHYQILIVSETYLLLKEIDRDSSSYGATYSYNRVRKFFWE